MARLFYAVLIFRDGHSVYDGWIEAAGNGIRDRSQGKKSLECGDKPTGTPSDEVLQQHPE